MAAKKRAKKKAAKSAGINPVFEVGARVTHETLGRGTVRGDGAEAGTLAVRFFRPKARHADKDCAPESLRFTGAAGE